MRTNSLCALLTGAALALSTPAPAGAAVRDPVAAEAAARLGFENVTVLRGEDTLKVGFENRRYRHPAEAAGHLARPFGTGATFAERRFGLDAAAFEFVPAGRPGLIERLAGFAPDTVARVRYPSDDQYWRALRRPYVRPISRTLDIEVGPRLVYEFGRVLEPFVWSLDLEPRVRYVPWTGARLSASLLIPIHNDFERTELQPDLGRVRPGVVAAEQFFWVPGVALGSLNAGIFERNRYGASLGLARPMAGGRFLLDSQIDLTGFISFTDGEITYSTAELFTGFAGLTWHAPVYDVSVRGRAQWFLFGDRGIEVQVRRQIGDLGVAFYRQEVDGDGVDGIRIDIPIPPMTRSAPDPIRLQPVTRFPISYDDRGRAIGAALAGTASREAFLEGLSPGSLDSNFDRFVRARRAGRDPQTSRTPAWVALGGMSGFATTPWAGTIGDRNMELGYGYVPREWAYDHRGEHANAYYYGAIGFLPFAEVQVRWTQIVGLRDFEEIVPDSRLADLDRIASARLTLIEPRPGRPGLAIGMDDLVGTRRFHSTYAVAGLPGSILGVQSRAAFGYAPRAFEAPRHVLDGAFGAVEVQPWQAVRFQVEHDSEKWNAGLGIDAGFGLRLRLVALNMERLSAGAGWSWPL